MTPEERARAGHTRPWASSFGYAWAGVRHAWRTQRNIRVETGIGALAVAAAVWLRADVAPILVCCALVLGLELVNTAFEALVDLAAPTYHPLAKAAKDVAAAAVLVAAALSVLVGLVVLGPPLLARLGLGA